MTAVANLSWTRGAAWIGRGRRRRASSRITTRPSPHVGRSFGHRSLIFGHARLVGLLTVLISVLSDPGGLQAQDSDGCRILCAPDLTIEPTISIENVAGKHRTATLEDGIPVDTVVAETGEDEIRDDASPWSFSVVFVLPLESPE